MSLIGRHLPKHLGNPLFGDRERHGVVADEDDADWIAWQSEYLNFYEATQKSGIGARINDAGYAVLSGLSLDGLHVAEIGPGSLPHRAFWQGTPRLFTAIDINERFLEMTAARAGCPVETIMISKSDRCLSLATESVDLLLSFYSLEHLHPLADYLKDYARILKPGGRIVGAIPNEGGLAWGLGRYLTSRRWIRKHTSIDYDKIICWEHPNFADTIIEELDRRFKRKAISMFPLGALRSQNFSLITRFCYEKPVSGGG